MISKEARLDLDRLSRLGMVEAIWGEHKTFEQIAEILKSFSEAGQLAFCYKSVCRQS